jgi:hypothetical protein
MTRDCALHCRGAAMARVRGRASGVEQARFDMTFTHEHTHIALPTPSRASKLHNQRPVVARPQRLVSLHQPLHVITPAHTLGHATQHTHARLPAGATHTPTRTRTRKHTPTHAESARRLTAAAASCGAFGCTRGGICRQSTHPQQPNRHRPLHQARRTCGRNERKSFGKIGSKNRLL